MRPENKHELVAIATMLMLALSATGRPARATESMVLAHDGVTARILNAPFSGEIASLRDSTGTTLTMDQLPQPVTGYPLLETSTAVVAWTPDQGGWTFWTRRDDRLTRRGELVLSDAGGPARFHLMADDKHGFAVDMNFQNEKSHQVVALSRDGILEIRQSPGQTVVVRSPMRYALVPSLIGTDLLYDPEQFSVGVPSYLPSLNMVVGLQEGNEGVFVGVWPRGEQLAHVQVNENSRPRSFASFSLDTAGQSFFVAFLDHPGIWHEEPLRDDYLETHTAIAWQRPFDAHWIGRFFIDSEGYDFPFYFLAEKQKLWGRYIRGWFEYPVWFDGRKTMVHFEKKFPPQGTLLIYYLDTYRDDLDVLSPVAVMQKSLGKDEAARLLDFAGTHEQVLLEHRNAVCAMTAKIESYFAKGPDAAPQAEVQQYADDVSTFIRLIRERVFQFDRFAAEMHEMLQSEQQKQPSLAGALQPSDNLVVEIREVAEGDLPDTSLEEVRRWTDRIKMLAADSGEKNLAIVKQLTEQCRSVAGTQDDLARNLSVVTIRLMEEAARLGTASPHHVRIAEQMIVRCRSILRQPTWWEPCRKYLPRGNPGTK